MGNGSGDAAKLEERLVALLRLDYDRTNDFIQGVLSTINTLRGWAITLTVALVGFAFERNAWLLSLMASFVLLLFAYLDVYHSWLYSAAVRHAGDLENAIGSYHRFLAQADDDEMAILDFEADVKGHTFGLLRVLRRPAFRGMVVGARPRSMLVVVYGALLAVSIGSTVVIALALPEDTADRFEAEPHLIADTLAALTPEAIVGPGE